MMRYTIGCTDIISGKVGSFGYNIEEYINADKPLQFKAITPVFPCFAEFATWAEGEGIALDYNPKRMDWTGFKYDQTHTDEVGNAYKVIGNGLVMYWSRQCNGWTQDLGKDFSHLIPIVK